jgi:hypothetical protein
MSNLFGRPITVACLASFADATPLGYSERALQRYDRDTTYRIDEHSSGFTVTAYYSRYQFIPESDAVNAAGKSALLNIAYDTAYARGRAIEPIK